MLNLENEKLFPTKSFGDIQEGKDDQEPTDRPSPSAFCHLAAKYGIERISRNCCNKLNTEAVVPLVFS